MIGPEYGQLSGKSFFIWASACIGCFIFTYICIPEMRGLALELFDVLYTIATPRHSVYHPHQLVAWSTNAMGSLYPLVCEAAGREVTKESEGLYYLAYKMYDHLSIMSIRFFPVYCKVYSMGYTRRYITTD